jgi:hypothetical protein
MVEVPIEGAGSLELGAWSLEFLGPLFSIVSETGESKGFCDVS